jgi:hypothetical protein
VIVAKWAGATSEQMGDKHYLNYGITLDGPNCGLNYAATIGLGSLDISDSATESESS